MQQHWTKDKVSFSIVTKCCNCRKDLGLEFYFYHFGWWGFLGPVHPGCQTISAAVKQQLAMHRKM